jgi:hypothetical protein
MIQLYIWNTMLPLKLVLLLSIAQQVQVDTLCSSPTSISCYSHSPIGHYTNSPIGPYIHAFNCSLPLPTTYINPGFLLAHIHLSQALFGYPDRFFHDLSSVVRHMPRYKLWCKDGAQPAFTLRHSGFTKVPVHSRTIRSCDCATLGSNPRKLSNQSMPSHTCVFNKVKPHVFLFVVLRRDVTQLAQAQSLF